MTGMDRLSREAMLARQANMSYGKWKAMQDPVPIVNGLPEGWAVCPWCGKKFRVTNGKKYCELYCRSAAYAYRRREIDRESHARKRAEKRRLKKENKE